MASFEQPQSIERQEQERKVLERREIRGDKLESVTTFGYDDKGRVISEKKVYPRDPEKAGRSYEYFYDARGRLIKRKSHFELGRRDEKIIHDGELELEYDGDSSNPKLESYSRDGEISEMRENDYNDQGLLTWTKRISFAFGEIFEEESFFDYDEQGRLLERRNVSKYAPGGEYFRNVYDKNGRRMRTERGIVGSTRPFGVFKFKHDDKGRVIEESNFYGTEDEELLWRNRFKYDEQGNIVEQEFTNYRNGKSISTSKTAYEYKFA